jgi:Uma2 family endonuclease
MAQPLALPDERTLEMGGENIVVLRGVTWADYQRLLEIRGDRAVPRFTYLEGVLEIMSPSRSHDFIKSMIGCLVEGWCFENDVDITPYGSWTQESKEAEAGAEPDECYVLGDVGDPQRCDLAIEIVWRSRLVNKLEVYRRLRVREVWIWRKRRLEVHALRGDSYVRLERSELLPEIDLEFLLGFVERTPMTRAVREYRAALKAGARRPE